MADFVTLIVILEVDNFMVGHPLYSSFQAKYDELKMKLEERNDDEKDDVEAEHEVGEYGIENIRIPKVEKNLMNKLWVTFKTIHVLTFCFYIGRTFCGFNYGFLHDVIIVTTPELTTITTAAVVIAAKTAS